MNVDVIMDDTLNILLNNSLYDYYKLLSNFGNKTYKDVFKLIIVSYIRDILYNTELKESMTESEYHDIHKCLYILYGTTCLLPFPEYTKTAYFDSILI